MAFVYRSDRTNLLDKKKIALGPGEYNEELSKTQGRLLHKNHMKYSIMMKNSKPSIIPFNTTSKRSKLFEGDNIPGPGTYSLSNCFNSTYTKAPFKHGGSSLEKDIQEFISPMYKTNTNKKGFLSSEKRFNKSLTDSKISPGPGSYEIKSHFININNTNTSNKYMEEKYALNKGKMYKLPGSSDQIISSIPDKTKGEFKMIKGLLTEIKKQSDDFGLVGPGKYNIYTNWNTGGIIWDKGYKKDKNKYSEKKIQKELEKNSSMFNTENYSERMQMNNYNMSTISTNINVPQKSKNLSSVLTMTNMNTSSNNYNLNNSKNICSNTNNISGWNTTSNLIYNNSMKNGKPKVEKQMRNKIFHDFIKSREDLHYRTMSKLKDKKNVIIDLEYDEQPGPGFYNQSIMPKHISFMSTASNFGSTSPKFNSTKKENEVIGPGSYFKEKNKYQPKFKAVLHAKIPEKQKRKSNDSVFVQSLIKNNEEKMPGPGEYNVEGKLIKKEISNIKSFGSNVERFKYSKSSEEKDSSKNEIIDNDVKEYINQSITEEEKKEENRIKERQYIKKVELYKKQEKEKRQKYLKKLTPSVGTYSPEITSSIQYQVLSKLNPYRNQVAPFNIVDSRFAQIKNPRIKNIGTPGPADYNVLTAFNALNIDKRKYNVFGQNKQRESRIRNTFVPGPGIYNLDNPDIWNIKSYNVLFINNHK